MDAAFRLGPAAPPAVARHSRRAATEAGRAGTNDYIHPDELTRAMTEEQRNRRDAKKADLARLKEQFQKLGIEPAPMKPDDFAKFVRGQIDFYKKIVARAGITPQ